MGEARGEGIAEDVSDRCGGILLGVLLGFRGRSEEDQLFLGAGEGDVEGVQGVDVGVQLFVIVLLGEDRAAKLSLVIDGHGADGVKRCDAWPTPEDGLRLCVQPPIAEGQDDDIEAEAFGLVDGHDAERILCLRHSDLGPAARVFPPREEAVDVRPFALGIVRYEVEKGLHEDQLVLREVAPEAAADGLDRLIDRAMARKERIAGLGTVRVELGTNERRVGALPHALDTHGREQEAGGALQRRVVRAVHVAQHAHDEAHGRRAIELQPVIREDSEGRLRMLPTVRQQRARNEGCLGTRTGQHGDVSPRPTVSPQLTDDVHQTRHRLFLPLLLLTRMLKQLHAHVPGIGRSTFGQRLPTVRIGPEDAPAIERTTLRRQRRLGQSHVVSLLQPRGEEGEKRVVELHHATEAAPVLGQRTLRDAGREIEADALVEQGPVRVAEAVDALLHVAHDQVVVARAETVGHQRAEVAPLQRTGVLKLVDEIMPDARASLLVNEGDIAAVDDAREQFGGVGDEHAVLLVASTANLAGDVA